MRITPTELKAFERGLAVAKEAAPDVEKLRKIAESVPHIADRVQELATRNDYLNTMCETCIAVFRQ